MVQRVEDTPVVYPFRFVVAGDSGAWRDPTAGAIYGALVDQIGGLDPAPVFFANLGDFAGPGTTERHGAYLEAVAGLRVPNLCLVGNHDLDDETGWEQLLDVSTAPSTSRSPTGIRVSSRSTRSPASSARSTLQARAPRVRARTISRFSKPPSKPPKSPTASSSCTCRRTSTVIYAPHADWGFEQREAQFLSLLHKHDVTLVLCAHGLAFDTYVHDGIRFVMSGGGGTGLCSHYHGICTAGPARPEDRGALYHAVELTIDGRGTVSGRVIQAFEPVRRSGADHLRPVAPARAHSCFIRHNPAVRSATVQRVRDTVQEL